MNTLLMAVLALAVPSAFCYDEIFDKIDLDKILGDDSLFNKYIDCMLDKGPCDSLEHAPEFRSKLFNHCINVRHLELEKFVTLLQAQ